MDKNNDPFNLHGEMATLKYSQIGTGIIENNSIILTAYPNPCNEFLNIRMPDYTIEDVKINIIDNLGRTVETKVVYRNTLLQINTQEFSEGIYSLRIQSGKNVISGKFSVIH